MPFFLKFLEKAYCTFCQRCCTASVAFRVSILSYRPSDRVSDPLRRGLMKMFVVRAVNVGYLERLTIYFEVVSAGKALSAPRHLAKPLHQILNPEILTSRSSRQSSCDLFAPYISNHGPVSQLKYMNWDFKTNVAFSRSYSKTYSVPRRRKFTSLQSSFET